MNVSEIIDNIILLKHLKHPDNNFIKEAYELSKNVEINEILGGVKNNELNQIEFNSKCFIKYKHDENTYLQFLNNPEVEDGMFECKKCKSKKILTMSKQVRRADEPTTVFAKCSHCKYSWVVN